MMTQEQFDAVLWHKDMKAVIKGVVFYILSVDFKSRKVFLSNHKWYNFYLIDEVKEK